MGNKKFVIPYKFCGKEYSWEKDLYDAFMKQWDLAAAALKRGAIADHYAKLMKLDENNYHDWQFMYVRSRNLQEDMWNDKYHEDIVFAKFMYYLNLPRAFQRPRIPMDDMDVSKSNVFFGQRNKKLEGCYGSNYGSRNGDYKYDEDCYIAYMNEEAYNGNLYTYDCRGDERDAREPDESAGKKPEKRSILDGVGVRLDKALWWQEYLREIGEFQY